MKTPRGRVLLVEDEDLVSMLTEDMLTDLGYQVESSVATLAEGLAAASSGSFEVAVLDVNLRGTMSFPIADILLERGVPFVFASGYSDGGVEPRFANVHRLQKPFTQDLLETTLAKALGGQSLSSTESRTTQSGSR